MHHPRSVGIVSDHTSVGHFNTVWTVTVHRFHHVDSIAVLGEHNREVSSPSLRRDIASFSIMS